MRSEDSVQLLHGFAGVRLSGCYGKQIGRRFVDGVADTGWRWEGDSVAILVSFFQTNQRSFFFRVWVIWKNIWFAVIWVWRILLIVVMGFWVILRWRSCVIWADLVWIWIDFWKEELMTNIGLIAEGRYVSKKVYGYKWNGRRVECLSSEYNYSISRTFILCFSFSRFWFFNIVMSQSNLVRSEGSSKKGGASGSKRKVKVPLFDNSSLIEGYARTVIGRCMNPRKQDMKSLLFMFPRIWQLEGRVVGADLGLGRFQFDFETEEDIVEVLKMEPVHFDHWMVALVRWEPSVDPAYPSAITFWVRVLGVPLQFWADPTFRSIGEELGQVREVDIDGGRVRVMIDGFKPLCFETEVEFGNGEEVTVTLRYERLFGSCRFCHSLCHDIDHCGLVNPESRVRKFDDAPGDGDRRRNQSYKGAVVHDDKRGSDFEGKQRGRSKGHEDVVDAKVEGLQQQERSRHASTRVRSGFYHGEPSARPRRYKSYASLNAHRKFVTDEVTKEVTMLEPEEYAAGRNQAKLTRKALFQDEGDMKAVSEASVSSVELGIESVRISPVTSGAAEVEIEDQVEQPSVSYSSSDVALISEMHEGTVGESLDVGSEMMSGNADGGEGDVLPLEEEAVQLELFESGVVMEDMVTGGQDHDAGLATENMEELAGVDAMVSKEEVLGLEKGRKGKGVALVGASSKKRIASMLSTPRKRAAPKALGSQGEGNAKPRDADKGGPGGPKPPKPPVNK